MDRLKALLFRTITYLDIESYLTVVKEDLCVIPFLATL